MFILLSNCSVEEDRGVTAVVEASFSDESLTADATEFIELPKKSHSSTSSDTSSTIKKTLKRKYHDSYLDIGFAETPDNKPQCVICGKVLPNSSMFPAKMRRHFDGVHPEFKNKPTDFFRRKYIELRKVQKCISYHSKTVNEKALMASYFVSYRIAQAGEAHTVAENLIKPCVKDIIECMFDEKAAKVIDTIPLSNDTISRRIGELAENVKATLISRIKSTKFSLQMDESTDVAGLAILMVFVRYPYLDSFQEDLLLCKPLPTTTSGTEIFKLVDTFFSENSILWDNCVDVCTDGAKAMTGKISGAIAKIKEKAKGCSSSHCVLHRHALAMKKMPPFIKEVLDETVKIINFIKSRSKNTRLFKILCDDMGSLHTSLLLHTEIRWLSRGKSLMRLFELRNEVRIFMSDNDFVLGEKLCDDRWLMKLAYLADIFQKVNDVCISLQGKAVTVFDATDKVEGFKKKLKYWVESIKNGSLDCLPLTKGFEEELESDIPADILNEFEVHLLRLLDTLNFYFPKELHENLKENVWVVTPYSITEKPSSLTSQEYECLLDLTSDTALRSKFETMKSISDFWCTLKDEFKILSDKAKLILLPFATTYLCEAGFSAYAATKTKYRSRLNAEQDIQLQLSKIQPDIISLCKSKQAHTSH